MKCLAIFLFLFVGLGTLAQSGSESNTFTLEQCIDIAIKNNLDVQQRGLQAEAADVVRKQSKASLFPTLNGNIAHGINQGRSIDPFTNTYVNQKVSYASYGLGSNTILFNGFALQNSIRQYRYAHDATEMELQQAKDNLTLNVILAYLQVLSNEDLVAQAAQQLTVSQKQVERLEILNREGAISPPQLYDLRGQLKDDELALVTNRNQLETAKLALAQLMNIAYTKTLKLERIGMDDLLQQTATTADAVYTNAIANLAVIKAAALRKKSAAAALKAVRGELYPTVFLNGNLNTNFSSVATRDILLNSAEIPTTNYVVVNGSKTPVIAKTNNYASERIVYGDQLKNNIFSNIGLGLRIPIFNGLQTKSRIKLAAIELKSVELEEREALRQLRQEVEQAQLNRDNAYERYKVVLEQVAAYAASFRAAEVRFNAGVGTQIDYLIAKNNLDRANINLVVAKYDYLLRKKVVDFYNVAR